MLIEERLNSSLRLSSSLFPGWWLHLHLHKISTPKVPFGCGQSRCLCLAARRKHSAQGIILVASGLLMRRSPRLKTSGTDSLPITTFVLHMQPGPGQGLPCAIAKKRDAWPKTALSSLIIGPASLLLKFSTPTLLSPAIQDWAV